MLFDSVILCCEPYIYSNYFSSYGLVFSYEIFNAIEICKKELKEIDISKL